MRPGSSPGVGPKQKMLVSAAIVAVSVVVDQWVKWLAAQNLRGRPGFEYFGGAVQFEYVENTGAFLSLGAQMSPEARTLFFVVGVLFILAFCVFSLVRTARSWMSVVALALVISGGIGNLIDRVSRGSVIDFVHMGLGPVRTGVFNVADVAISVGLVLMLWAQYREKDDLPASSA